MIYCYYNIDGIYLRANSIFYSQIKNLPIDVHFICNLVQDGILHVTHVSSIDQVANTLTKTLPRTFIDLRLIKARA